MKAKKKELLLWLEMHKNTQAMRDYIMRHKFTLEEIDWLRTHMQVELKAAFKGQVAGEKNAAA